MVLDRNEGFADVQRIVTTVHILLICSLNNDLEVLVIPLKVHTYISTENDVIICTAIATVIRRA